MKPSHHLRALVKVHFLLVLVATLESRVTGHLCPKGQVEHQDGPRLRCCLPVSCDPDYHVDFCKEDGQNDNCTSCGDEHWLPKRTSSFNPQNCKPRRLSRDSCQEVPGPQKPTDDELRWCYCNPETGSYYYEPEVAIFTGAVCQPIYKVCTAGQEPTLNGTCRPCPPNTFQEVDGSYKLCFPQRNCSAMGLETLDPGSASKEAECAKPPPSPTDTPPLPTHRKSSSTRPAPLTTTTPRSTSTNTTEDKVRIGTVRNQGSESNTHIIIIAVVCPVILVLVVCLILYLRRRRMIRGCACLDSERPSWGGSDHSGPSRDNDNTSDNSCCACADSCIASSSKSSSNGACGKSSASMASDEKQVPMLEGYMNGKCQKGPLDEVSFSEPFYSSISGGGEEGKMANGNLPSYTNLNGVRPTMLKQEDFYNYPNKVHLPAGDEDDENNAANKARQAKRQQAGGVESAGEGFTETDPLLPNGESASSGVPTPNVQPLRGILRNGNNNHRQEPRGRGGGGEGGGGGASGNRPNLSMLLSEGSSASYNSGGGDSYQMQDLPHFSQLVSNTARTNPSSMWEEAPEQHVHELPQQLQQRLLQHQQLQQQQPQQEASTLPTRLIPAVPVTTSTQPQLNPSLVQMEELKPVMPLSPPAVNSPTSAPPTGAANVTESKGRSGSPARINPSQQEEMRGRGGSREIISQKAVDTSPDKSTAAGKVASKEDSPDEQTFSKQTLPASSPGAEDDEETAHKSIGGSSGLGESLDVSSLSEEGRRSRNQYRRSQSEVSRSVSPSQPLPRSISSPEEKHRPFAVVKPMQSDQSLNNSHDQLTELAQQLDSTRCQYPLHSLRPNTARRQVSQDSSDDPDLTRPKTPDRLSEDENEDNNNDDDGTQDDSEDRT